MRECILRNYRLQDIIDIFILYVALYILSITLYKYLANISEIKRGGKNGRRIMESILSVIGIS